VSPSSGNAETPMLIVGRTSPQSLEAMRGDERADGFAHLLAVALAVSGQEGGELVSTGQINAVFG
jgi:hypothetical protein